MTTSNALRRSCHDEKRAADLEDFCGPCHWETCLRPGREHAVTGADSTMTNLPPKWCEASVYRLPAGRNRKTPLFYGIAARVGYFCDDGARERLLDNNAAGSRP